VELATADSTGQRNGRPLVVAFRASPDEHQVLALEVIEFPPSSNERTPVARSVATVE